MNNLPDFPSLTEAFNITHLPELIALVGGGGKTSLLFALAAALPGRVVITTTTRIFSAQMKLAQAICYADDLADLTEKLDEVGRVLIVGQVQGEKALGVPPALPAQLLARSDVDFVLVEADGSRMRPIKAPADHEPVIPSETTLVIPVVGIDALDGPLEEVAHRPERVSAVISEHCSVFSGRLNAKEVAFLLTHLQGGMKGVPDGARVIPLINKVESERQLQSARQIARSILRNPHPAFRIPQVVIGAVNTDLPIREVQRQVTAVILAAGEGKRMGQTKQLLPWGETTILGQTIRNLKQTAVTHILVITGHEAEKIAAIATQESVPIRHNPNYASGEMLSSLQTAVRHLITPAPQPLSLSSPAAILVILADQPMIKPATIDQLLIAFWRREGELIAPVYNGRRGNPVLIGHRYFTELLALPVGEAPRTLLQRHAADLLLIPVNTNSVLQDLDSPEQYERLYRDSVKSNDNATKPRWNRYE
ncbi:MAG: putative selenium-dependent hydroxylase accessory protein YqeC [Chloroflexi bacterium]|nr:putative selenium-dependent hydroxylase accessory protein YqeC [Chloroflexota bacterium]